MDASAFTDLSDVFHNMAAVRRLSERSGSDRWRDPTILGTRKRAPMLPGKTAIVTGSTSGIGLGIAQALADAGAIIVINGFGDAKAIEETRAALAREHNVGV